MKAKQPDSVATTTSYGALLHWTSHYLQSSLSAATGYVEMVQELAPAKQSELLDNAQLALVRSQAVLKSVNLLHQLMEREPLQPEPSQLERLITDVGLICEQSVQYKRTRHLPVVLVNHWAAAEGISSFIISARAQSKRSKLSMAFRQRGDTGVVHLALGRVDSSLLKLTRSLARVPAGRFPLVSSEYSGLAAGFVLMRAAGINLVVRPAKPRYLDIYLHFKIVRQLSLVDLNLDIG